MSDIKIISSTVKGKVTETQEDQPTRQPENTNTAPQHHEPDDVQDTVLDDGDLYGLIAEFDDPDVLVAAAEKARDAGYKVMDAYAPFPVHGLDDALGFEPTRLGFAVLAMGAIGGTAGFFMQWFANVVHYPLNIGGRPLNSWPNFIVITFELTVIFSAFTAGLLMLARNGLPEYYHSIFNARNFERATRDGFFLCIEKKDAKFDREETRSFLESLQPVRVSEVER